jgi:hypothetical protein
VPEISSGATYCADPYGVANSSPGGTNWEEPRSMILIWPSGPKRMF